MDEIIVFLSARLDEDEAAARAATPGPWAAGGSPGAEYLPRDHVHAPDYRPEGFSKGQHVGDASVADGGMGPWAVHVSGSGFPLANATHIVRHDPARALREVAAGRKRLEIHKPEVFRRYGGDETCCAVCVTDHEAYMDDADPDPWPCETIRADLSVHCDHPGYRAEWSPSEAVSPPV